MPLPSRAWAGLSWDVVIGLPQEGGKGCHRVPVRSSLPQGADPNRVIQMVSGQTHVVQNTIGLRPGSRPSARIRGGRLLLEFSRCYVPAIRVYTQAQGADHACPLHRQR